MFFSDWWTLLRIAVVGCLGYVGLIALLRLSGKRTLSKMNAFDLVVTVALGSTLATMLLSKDVALVDGLLGLALLIGLQFAVAWLASRSRLVSRLVKSEPRLLFYRGKLLHDALRTERVTQDEVLAAMRAQGLRSPAQAEAVVLETDGEIHVIWRGEGEGAGTLEPVEGFERS